MTTRLDRRSVLAQAGAMAASLRAPSALGAAAVATTPPAPVVAPGIARLWAVATTITRGHPFNCTPDEAAEEGLGRERGEAVSAYVGLHKAGGDDVVALCAWGMRSPEPAMQDVALDVFAEIRTLSNAQGALLTALALPLTSVAHSDTIRGTAVRALCCQWRDESYPTLASYVDANDALVRGAVAFHLFGRTELSVRLLCKAAADPEREVRDWASFHLAETSDLDTPLQRRTLRTLLHDADSIVRAQAVLGLARRRDAAGDEELLRLLSHPEDCFAQAFEAAGLRADPKFASILEWNIEMGLSDYMYERCEWALARCQGTLDVERFTDLVTAETIDAD